MDVYRDFYAKILLFGEYSVICNSMGLTMPYARYSGRFRKMDNLSEEQQLSSENLQKFYHYLKQLAVKSKLPASMDLEMFRVNLNNGLYFDSNIPQGYGIGSSGALCAAVFDRYGLEKKKELHELKKIFSLMESWFHGISSGLDPLISYLNKPLLIRDKETLEITETPKGLLSEKIITFLVDTGQSGKTNHLVQMFFDKCRYRKFYKGIKNILIPLNNSCIDKFMSGDDQAFIPEVKRLSAFFLEHFNPMIPENFQKFWKNGVREDNPYTLKLCGSGGGGFLLGFSTDMKATEYELRNYKLYKIR